MSGKLLVIDGLDGSGKATQRAFLENRLLEEGHRLRGLSFPNYDSSACAPVKMYLAGEFGQKADDVNAYAASTFYAVDRYASYKMNWGEFYHSGGLLLADRYATSNLIHQCAKLPKQEWANFARWMEEFEYNKLGIPKPDLVLFLDVALEISQGLLQKRYQGQQVKDIHEQDTEYLARCREAALWCVETQGWCVISCTENGALRTAEDIHKDVYKHIKEWI